MKQSNCIFDRKVDVCFLVQGNMGGHWYAGKRTIVCTKAIGCYECGWNPEVEERRKYNGLKKRHGYVESDGTIADTRTIYRCMRP